MKASPKPAILALADGNIFEGIAIGRDGLRCGEVVFNTAMTGYQEILTDPSYSQQIITLTYPHIGNTGITKEDGESRHVWAKGLVVREASLCTSSWRSLGTLHDFLVRQGVVGISGVDTRRLTHLLRDKGAQAGCIMSGQIDEEQALAAARSFPGLKDVDLARHVTTDQIHTWRDSPRNGKYHVVVYDFGVKKQILTLLAQRDCRITVVPATTTAEEALSLQPDGIMLSNGPGDPAACEYAIQNVSSLIDAEIPMFGICLGYQILSLACGARTEKMKFGHHGANHPVQCLKTQRVLISSQNHGFAVEEVSLPDNLQITHRSLFDNTVQGVRHTEKALFGFQGHPEAGPGPRDLADLFDTFIGFMEVSPGANNPEAVKTNVLVE